MGLSNSFAAGSEISAASLQFVAPVAAYKYADFDMDPNLTGNTSLTADPDLNLALDANGVYAGYGLIIGAASTAADYKATFTVPAGAQGGWSPNLYVAVGGSVFTTASFLGFGTTFGTAGQGTAQNISFTVQFTVVMGATAGNLQYEFAQYNSDNSSCHTRAYSYLLAWRVA